MTSSQFPTLDVRIERFPIAGSFTISRGAKTEAVTIVAELRQGGRTGRGECVPYPRYGETPEATLKALEAIQEAVSDGFDRQALQTAMPAGAARNALDCAFVDLEAKRAGSGLGPARPARAAALHHGLYHFAGVARRHGGRDREGSAPSAPEDQARRRWRWRADRGGAARRTQIRTDRRCQ